MKLYATITSERASKGQGGNEKLEIDILVYDRQNPLYHLSITPDELIFTERGYSQPLLTRSHNDIREQEEEKGKKQKGEKMYRCTKCRKWKRALEMIKCSHPESDYIAIS